MIVRKNRPHLNDETLERYADRDLRGAKAAAAERHLESCEACRTRLAEWESLFLQMATLPRFAPAPGFADRVMVRVVAAAQPAKARAAWQPVVATWGRRLWPAAAAAATVWTFTVGGALAWVSRRADVGPGELLGWGIVQARDAFWTTLVRVAGAIQLPAVEVDVAGLLAFAAFLSLLALWGARILLRYAVSTTKVRLYA